MQILKRNCLLSGFQTKQSRMLRSVQISLFIIPTLQKLLKNCTFTSVLPRITENFTICFRDPRVAKLPKMFTEDKVLRQWTASENRNSITEKLFKWEKLVKRWFLEDNPFSFLSVRWANKRQHPPLKIKAQKCTWKILRKLRLTEKCTRRNNQGGKWCSA